MIAAVYLLPAGFAALNPSFSLMATILAGCMVALQVLLCRTLISTSLHTSAQQLLRGLIALILLLALWRIIYLQAGWPHETLGWVLLTGVLPALWLSYQPKLTLKHVIHHALCWASLTAGLTGLVVAQLWLGNTYVTWNTDPALWLAAIVWVTVIHQFFKDIHHDA